MNSQVVNVNVSVLPVPSVMQPDLVIAMSPFPSRTFLCAYVLEFAQKSKRTALTYLFSSPMTCRVVAIFLDRFAVIYKGVIVEVAETEELTTNSPIYSSLKSAVPIPDPILERKKVLKVYDPSQHDYETDKPSMVETVQVTMFGRTKLN